MALKGTRFHSVEEIEARVTTVLKMIPKEEFFAACIESSKACIEKEKEEECMLKINKQTFSYV